jgi:hypothetical protein
VVVVQIGLLNRISPKDHCWFCFSASQEKKSNEVNRKPIVAVDKENEIEKRNKELAKARELREKQTKEEVNSKRI